MCSSDYIAIIAAFVAFLSLGAQLYVGNNDVGTNLYQHITTLFYNMNAPFLKYPELRPFFYENKEPSNLSEIDLNRIQVIAEMFLDTFEWVEHDIKRAKKFDKEAWRSFMTSIYSSSTILQEFHNQNPLWHPLFDNLIRKSKVRK